jgi:hypothetical protein
LFSTVAYASKRIDRTFLLLRHRSLLLRTVETSHGRFHTFRTNNDYVITSHDQDQGSDLVMKEKNGDEQNSAPMTMTKDPNHKDPKKTMRKTMTTQ